MDETLTTEDLTGRRDPAPVDAAATADTPAPGGTPPAAADGAPAGGGTRAEPLLPGDDAARFDGRWREIQVGFVDEPRTAVEQADQLVAELMRHLASTFADERARLERAWSAGEDVDTEALRVALTRYRSFFQRLLAA